MCRLLKKIPNRAYAFDKPRPRNPKPDLRLMFFGAQALALQLLQRLLDLLQLVGQLLGRMDFGFGSPYFSEKDRTHPHTNCQLVARISCGCERIKNASPHQGERLRVFAVALARRFMAFKRTRRKEVYTFGRQSCGRLPQFQKRKATTSGPTKKKKPRSGGGGPKAVNEPGGQDRKAMLGVRCLRTGEVPMPKSDRLDFSPQNHEP